MKWIILFINVISFSFFLGSQTLSETFLFAEEQLALGWEIRAEKAFKRVLYFDNQNLYRGRCMEVLAELSLKNGKYQDALNYLDQAYFLASDPILQNEFQTQRIQIYIETGQIQKALSEIYQMDESFSAARISLYQAYCHYWLKEFDEMESSLSGLIDEKELRALRSKAEKIERMNPGFYQTMSYILPGLGQILLGDFKQSANSMALSSGLVILFVNTARKLSLFDAIISVVPWFYRYYSGGAKLTKQLAIEKKRKRHQKNLRDILGIVQGH